MKQTQATVFAALWNDPKYQRLHAAKDRRAAAWNHADAYRLPTTPALLKRYQAALRRMYAYEDAALRKAGLPV